MQALLALILIIPLIFGLVYILKKWVVQADFKDPGIKLVKQFSLSNKERIIVVEVEDIKLIIGVSPQAFNTLHVVEKNA